MLVGADNKSLSSMATDELLELFSLGDASPSSTSAPVEGPTAAKRQRKTAGKQAAAAAGGPSAEGDNIWALDQLWDTSQYEEQHSVEAFIKNAQLS